MLVHMVYRLTPRLTSKGRLHIHSIVVMSYSEPKFKKKVATNENLLGTVTLAIRYFVYMHLD